jgi:uridine kinase
MTSDIYRDIESSLTAEVTLLSLDNYYNKFAFIKLPENICVSFYKMTTIYLSPGISATKV